MTPPARSGDAPSGDQINLIPPSRGRDGRSLNSATTVASAMTSRTPGSFATAPPGSFSSDLRSIPSRNDTPKLDFGSYVVVGGNDDESTPEQRQADLQDRIEKETKIKIGSENLLEALNSKNAKQTRDQRLKVEQELQTSNRKIAALRQGLEIEIQRAKELKSPPAPPESRLSYLFRRATSRSPSRLYPDKTDDEQETESPTLVLADLLQGLEASGHQPEYYVEKANALVELLKRHPTLKYDLAWSIFGLRIQTMLLSDNREVVAAGYRVMRYAITDRKSLQIIRGLHTDYLVILSLVKESKASVEREQALKFVRGFLDVKGGVEEISRAIIRIIVAVAEHADDRLKNIAILTLAEILIKKPQLLVSAGGMGTLTDALGEGNYYAAESLAGSFLYLLDTPQRRKFLRSGHELEAPFAIFTDTAANHGHMHEEKLKANAKVVATLMRSWPGLLSLCMNDFLAIRSLLMSLYIPIVHVRNVLLELLFDILRIKPPSWSSSFLAGRRLTTYGRVTNLKNPDIKDTTSPDAENCTNKWNLLEHYVAVMLAVLLHSGLMPALLHAEEDPLTLPLKRKTTLLLGEVLKMANELLPPSWSASLQVMPQLLQSAAKFSVEDRFVAIGTIYQVDSVNRTLYRSGPSTVHNAKLGTSSEKDSSARQAADQSKTQAGMQMDEAQFRTLLLETQVLNTVNFQKWRWDIILSIIEGPLLNPKRLDEAMKATKFIHRLLGFYRPFKYRFSEIRNTKPNQRYVRAGCALMKSLLQNPEGVRYLNDNKFIRQLAECLSHFDRMSGLTSESPIFMATRMTESLTGGYFALLGELSKDPKGIQILERWRVINMFYHIVELHDRDDLIMILLSNMDYSIDGHLRVIISKAMTSCSKEIRIFSTRLLRKYATKSIATRDSSEDIAEWAIRLLVTQLYDPEIEVCEVAIKILEEACNQKQSLEYVVKCRPALDHLGEIGAPLLLRFLSTSVGYHYLDGLDYITKEMDDWFLGRNDTYVALIEASMARALADIPEKPQTLLSYEETPETPEYGIVPPHFYRELTRTKEGCKLLEQKGHFDEFVATIRDFGAEDEDPETILKLKGCLWAVGNVGSMELGAPFLEKSDVVTWIVQIAENSEVMSLRGTAFFVLGLISRSLHGQEILLEHGWDGVVNEMGEALGFCLPLEFKKLFSIKPWAASPDGNNWKRTGTVKVAITDVDPLNARILKLATDLGNTVLAKKAANDLQIIKAKKAPGFQQAAIFHKVMQILEAHHFRLPACRFILDLFDRRVLRQIVLEEEDEEEGEEEEGEEEESDDDDSGAEEEPSATNGTSRPS